MEETKKQLKKKLTKTKLAIVIVASMLVVAGGIVAGLMIRNNGNVQKNCPKGYHSWGGPLADGKWSRTCVKDSEYPQGDGPDLKPIIYLYPTQETAVNVKLGRPELITTSYPKYDSQTGWNVIAQPDGNLAYISNSNANNGNRQLYSLYWEGKNKPGYIHNDGFVVKGADIAGFLEDKLSQLGLSDREAEEFIIYWLPKLEHNEYNYIRFETAKEISDYMPLTINPKPDTIIRIAMDWKKLDNEEASTLQRTLKEQKLPTTPARTGFTVVEWGGSEIGSQSKE